MGLNVYICKFTDHWKVVRASHIDEDLKQFSDVLPIYNKKQAVTEANNLLQFGDEIVWISSEFVSVLKGA